MGALIDKEKLIYAEARDLDIDVHPGTHPEVSDRLDLHLPSFPVLGRDQASQQVIDLRLGHILIHALIQLQLSPLLNPAAVLDFEGFPFARFLVIPVQHDVVICVLIDGLAISEVRHQTPLTDNKAVFHIVDVLERQLPEVIVKYKVRAVLNQRLIQGPADHIHERLIVLIKIRDLIFGVHQLPGLQIEILGDPLDDLRRGYAGQHIGMVCLKISELVVGQDLRLTVSTHLEFEDIPHEYLVRAVRQLDDIPVLVFEFLILIDATVNQSKLQRGSLADPGCGVPDILDYIGYIPDVPVLIINYDFH